MVGTGHDGFTARSTNSRKNRFVVGRHNDAAHRRSHGALPYVHDHGLAGDIGQRLVGQSGRLHPGRNDD